MRLDKSEKLQTSLNLMSGILTMVVQIAVNFFLSPYIVKTLGEEANGFTQLANNFVQYATLITVAFNSMAGRFMSVSYHKGDTEQTKRYYSSIVVCNIIICAILIPVAMIIVARLESIVVFDRANPFDVKALFTCVFVNFFANLVLSLYALSMFVTNRIYIQNVFNLVRNMLNAIVLLIVFSVFPTRLYYVSLVAMVLTLINIPIFKVYHSKLLPAIKFKKEMFSKAAVSEMLKSGIWNTVNQCGNMLMTGLDLLLTNWFINPTMMGVLSIAKIIPNAIISLATVLNTSFAPALTINWAKGNKSGVLSELHRNMKISSVILSIPIITFTVFSESFYSLWVPSLDSKVLAILSFLTIMSFVPWAGPQTLYNVFSITNKLKVNSIAFIVSGILNVAIVYILLQTTTLGIYAVAGVSSFLSLIRNLLITAPYTARILKLKWYVFYKDVIISLGCCAINAVVGMSLYRLINVNSWIKLILAVGMTVVLTFILDCCFVLSKEERNILLKKITRR